MRIPERLQCDRHVEGDPACTNNARPRRYHQDRDGEADGDPQFIEGVECDDLCDAAHEAVLEAVRQATKKLTKKTRTTKPKTDAGATE